MEDHQVMVGFVLHLNYQNPYISPFEEFQRFKTHPIFRDTFAGGKRISYGARAITEGGYQSVPRLTFPGGLLVGCAAGFVNVPRIKGSHNAVLSGIQAAEHLADALAAGRGHDEVVSYEQSWRRSAVGQDLYKVRNVKPLWSKFGTYLGIPLGALDMWTNTLGFSFFGTVKHGKTDAASLKPAAEFKPIVYPKPDGVLTFDKLSSVFISNTNHEETSRFTSRSRTWSCRSAPSTMSLPAPPTAIARRGSMSGWRRRRVRASRSMRRTASTAKPATSRIRTRISTGRRRKAAAGRTIPICERLSPARTQTGGPSAARSGFGGNLRRRQAAMKPPSTNSSSPPM